MKKKMKIEILIGILLIVIGLGVYAVNEIYYNSSNVCYNSNSTKPLSASITTGTYCWCAYFFNSKLKYSVNL